jgi:hypothetical protein
VTALELSGRNLHMMIYHHRAVDPAVVGGYCE